MKKSIQYLFLILVGFFALMVTAAAQNVIDTTLIDPANPGSIIAPKTTGALTTSVIVILTFLSAAIPGIKKIKYSYLRAGITVFVVVIGAATFKFGFFTSESLQYLLSGILPNFAYSGFVWETLKFILKMVGIDIKNLTPGSIDNTKVSGS